jgi:hypothetical protein
MDPSDSQQPPQSSGSQSNAASASSAAPKPPIGEVKPRLTKDQHDVLEQHFQQQHKPSTNVKKEFAARLNVPLDKINVSSRHGCVHRMLQETNSIAELVPEPQSQGQAGSQEDAESV